MNQPATNSSIYSLNTLDEVQLRGSISVSGESNSFVNENSFSPHSVLTQQQLMLGGHQFRQLVNANQKTVGANINTVAETFQILGMRVSAANITSHSASTYTFDNIFCANISTAVIPINNEIDVFFHGVALQFQQSIYWVARINFGVPFAKTVPLAGVPAASGADRQWGVEFYYNTADLKFYGRLYYFFGSMVYGTPFILPLYKDAPISAWGGFIYSIRMRQVVLGNNKLRLEFYINDSTSNSGGTSLSKITPTSSLETDSIPALNFKFNGKHVNFEVATSSVDNPISATRMQCTNIYCQFK